MASAQVNVGLPSNAIRSDKSSLRERLAFALNILFWMIFVGTLAVDFQERKETTEPSLAETIEEVEPQIINVDQVEP